MKIIQSLTFLLINLSVASKATTIPRGNGSISRVRVASVFGENNGTEGDTPGAAGSNSSSVPSASPTVTSNNSTEVDSSGPSASPTVTSNITTEVDSSGPSASPSVTASNSPTEVHSSAPSTVAVDPKPYQANNGELPENGEQKPGNKGTSPFVYVMVSGIIAFGGVMFIRYRRRQRLLSDREIVMGSPSRGHLNELYYDNDLI